MVLSFRSSECSACAKSYEFVHSKTSPHYPQANGEVVQAVQTVNCDLLKKGTDPFKALLNYRKTPLEGTGLSSPQLVMWGAD